MATVTDLNTVMRCRHCRSNVQIETYHDEAKRQTCYRVYHPHRDVRLPTTSGSVTLQADSMAYVFTIPDYRLSNLSPKLLMLDVQQRIDTAMTDFETRCRAAEQHATPPPPTISAMVDHAMTNNATPNPFSGFHAAAVAVEQKPMLIGTPNPPGLLSPAGVCAQSGMDYADCLDTNAGALSVAPSVPQYPPTTDCTTGTWGAPEKRPEPLKVFHNERLAVPYEPTPRTVRRIIR